MNSDHYLLEWIRRNATFILAAYCMSPHAPKGRRFHWRGDSADLFQSANEMK